MTQEPAFDPAAFNAALQQALLSTTRLATAIPGPGDLKFQRTLSRPLGKKVDKVSNRLLELTSRSVHLARQAPALQQQQQKHPYSSSAAHASQDKGKRVTRETLQEDDLVDGYQRNVVDITDQLLEKLDMNLDLAKKLGPASTTSAPSKSASSNPATTGHANSTPIQHDNRGSAEASTSTLANTTGVGPSFKTLPPGLSASDPLLAKPQLKFSSTVDNSRSAIFKPLISEKVHALQPLDTSSTLHYDQEMQVERLRIPNPYAHEIEQAAKKPLPDLPPYIDQYTQLDEEGRMVSSMDRKPFTFVDTLQALRETLDKLSVEEIIAVDLEHHDYRSFRGITCLMQLSTAKEDFLVDVLVPEVRDELKSLNKVFASPDIVKVLHGAESDIIWLQRDFGLYIVNLFDTFHASQALGRTTGHSLKSLLAEYTTFVPDKRYQLADWRLRPLPQEMVHYARSDTHFLHHIYKQLLSDPRMPQVLDTVRQKSANTAQQTYEHIAYELESGLGAGGWRALAERNGKTRIWGVDESTEQQDRIGSGWIDAKGIVAFEVFKAVFNWRDAVARDLDESWRYILSNKTLWRICDAPPVLQSQLAQLLGSESKAMPQPLQDDLLAVITKAKSAGEQKAAERRAVAATATAAAAPAGSTASDVSIRQPGTANSEDTGPADITPAPSASVSVLFDKAERASPPSRTAMQLYAIASSTSTLFPGSPWAGAQRVESRKSGSQPVTFETVQAKVHDGLLEDMAQSSHLITQADLASTTAIGEGHTGESAEALAGDVQSEEAKPASILTGDHLFVKRLARQDANNGEEAADKIILQGAGARGKNGKKRSVPDVSQDDDRGSHAPKAPKEEAQTAAFDYSNVKSVLDAPPGESSADAAKARKKAKKAAGGKSAEAYDASFRNAPKSMNAPKHGARSQTFTR